MATSKMSIARAFTTRRNKAPQVESSGPARASSTRKMPISRAQISMPVALISTTNMLSYNAPDIANARQISASSSASSRSSEDSDARSTSSTREGTVTDASSIGSAPSSPNALKDNHLSGYFAAANNRTQVSSPIESMPALSPSSPRRSASTASFSRDPPTPTSLELKPAVPQRALSHSKASHEKLARQRSLRNSASSPRPSRNSHEQRSSVDIFKAGEDPTHPFGKELEELKEVAEELGGVVSEASTNEDYSFMMSNNLAKFDVSDYLCEIKPLFAGVFNKQIVAIQSGWI